MTTRNVILAVNDAIVSGGFVLQRETETVIYQSSEIPAMQLKWFVLARRRETQRFPLWYLFISVSIY